MQQNRVFYVQIVVLRAILMHFVSKYSISYILVMAFKKNILYFSEILKLRANLKSCSCSVAWKATLKELSKRKVCGKYLGIFQLTTRLCIGQEWEVFSIGSVWKKHAVCRALALWYGEENSVNFVKRVVRRVNQIAKGKLKRKRRSNGEV